MRGYLEKRATDSALAKNVLARLRESRYLDDARYAAEFARARAQVRRQGRYRITRELRVRGVADEYIEPALEQAFAGMDERATVRKVIARRMRSSREAKFDSKRVASLYGTLLRKGFDSQLIRSELQNAVRGASELDIPEVDPNDSSE
jgi:regulatory protein